MPPFVRLALVLVTTFALSSGSAQARHNLRRPFFGNGRQSQSLLGSNRFAPGFARRNVSPRFLRRAQRLRAFRRFGGHRRGNVPRFVQGGGSQQASLLGTLGALGLGGASGLGNLGGGDDLGALGGADGAGGLDEAAVAQLLGTLLQQ